MIIKDHPCSGGLWARRASLWFDRAVDLIGPPVTGDGEVYQDNLDNDVANLFDKWTFSGTWPSWQAWARRLSIEG